jgi:hypothetical protein
VWLLALGVLWRPVSDLYLKGLQTLTRVAAEQFELVLRHGPNGLSAWFVVAVAVIAASALTTRRRVLVIALLTVAVTLVDATFVLLAASSGASQDVAEVAYGTIVALLPVCAVLVAIEGRPASLWSAPRIAEKSGHKKSKGRPKKRA